MRSLSGNIVARAPRGQEILEAATIFITWFFLHGTFFIIAFPIVTVFPLSSPPAFTVNFWLSIRLVPPSGIIGAVACVRNVFLYTQEDAIIEE